MTLNVYTARITYRGPDRLDVTRKSAGPDGIVFAPSWELLGPMIQVRKSRGHEAVTRLWPPYVDDYTREMRVSYVKHRAVWTRLLSRDEVTLLCYCKDSRFCHRTVLADILGKLGAKVCVER